MANSLDLLQGTLDLLILRTLGWGAGPMHGYTVARSIKERSKNVFLVEEGALYPALHRLERKGWIESEWGVSENNRKAKFYQLTTRGRAALRSELAEWNRYTKAVAGVLQPV
jgi:transcriptional regulator